MHVLDILERVGTLDAIRACIVSKRTQNLPAMLSQIVIVLGAWELHRHNGVVVEVMDKILATRSPQIPIRKLKLRFIMRGDDHLRIGRSVALAMASQEMDAAEFEVMTKRYFTPGNHPDPVYFAKQFNAFIGECPDAFAGLTRLHLQNLRFGNGSNVVAKILSTCKRLESLRLFRCDAGEGSVLRVVEHARLVELEIEFGQSLRVELNCLPKLQRISYNNWFYATYPLDLGFVPQLSKLALSCAYGIMNTAIALNLSQLLVNVPSIESLHLDFQSKKIWIRPECPKLLTPLLGKLRLVNLDNLSEECDFTWTMFFLEAAPSLQDLCITVWNHNCQAKSQKSHPEKTIFKWEPSGADFKHKNMANLTIHGFQSEENFMRYVRRIMEVAVNIKDVSLHEKKVCKVCIDRLDHPKVPSSTYPQTIEEKDSVRKQIIEKLVTVSPTMIRFWPSCYYTPRESM